MFTEIIPRRKLHFRHKRACLRIIFVVRTGCTLFRAHLPRIPCVDPGIQNRTGPVKSSIILQLPVSRLAAFRLTAALHHMPHPGDPNYNHQQRRKHCAAGHQSSS